MHAFVTYFGNIGSPFRRSLFFFFELLFPFVCPTRPLETEYAPRAILPILLVERSLIPHGALSCSIEYCLLFKRKTPKIWFCSWKLNLSMQLAILIKDVFLEVFMMIPLWGLVHYGPLCALRALLAPSVVCKKHVKFWFGLIFSNWWSRLLSHALKTALLSKRFQMLWDHTFYEKRFFTKRIHGRTLFYWLGSIVFLYRVIIHKFN